MKFNELSDDKKVSFVKDKYAEILGEIVADKSQLDKYVPLAKEPVFTKPKLLEEGMDVEKKNDTILKTATEAFQAQKKEYEAAKAVRDKIVETLANVKEREDCICEPRELDIDINYIRPEFEIFIDFARSRAEAQTY